VLPAGYAVAVQGCLPQYTWCDVIAGPTRGWLYAGNINYFYQNTYVPVLEYGPLIGIGVLGFVLNDYWGSFYPDRPFYRDRHRWSRHRPPSDRAFVPRHALPAPQRPGLIGPRERPEHSFPRQRPDHIGPGQRPGQIGPRPPPPQSSFSGGAVPRPPSTGVAPRSAPGAVQPGAVRPPPPQSHARPEATPRVGRPAQGGAAEPRGRFQRGERGERGPERQQ
jgi:hypothetical protein